MILDMAVRKISLYECEATVGANGNTCWVSAEERLTYGDELWNVSIFLSPEGICKMVATLPEDIPGLKEAVLALAEEWAPEPDLAESVCKGVKQQAELLRRELRAARVAAQLEECERLLGRLIGRAGYSPKAGAACVMKQRICELEAEGEST